MYIYIYIHIFFFNIYIYIYIHVPMFGRVYVFWTMSLKSEILFNEINITNIHSMIMKFLAVLVLNKQRFRLSQKLQFIPTHSIFRWAVRNELELYDVQTRSNYYLSSDDLVILGFSCAPSANISRPSTFHASCVSVFSCPSGFAQG